MKTTAKKLAVILMLCLTVTATVTPVFGENTQENGVTGTAIQQGVKAVITTNKQEYKDGEEIEFSLHIENQSDSTISSANVSYDIGDGLCVLDANHNKKKSAKFGKISSGKEKAIFGIIGQDPQETILPWVPSLYSVFLAGIIILSILLAAMILYYLFARTKTHKGRTRHHCIIPVFLAGLFLLSASAHTMAKEEVQKQADMVISPVVIVPYGEGETVIRMDISLYLTN